MVTNIINFTLNNFKIFKETFALFSNLKAYNKFIIGAYAFDTNKVFTDPVPNYIRIPPGTNSSNCLGSHTTGFSDSYVCLKDYDDAFDTAVTCNDTGKYFNPIFGSSATCLACPTNPGCNTACMGSNATGHCSCQQNNARSSILLNNSKATICKSPDYINFSKVNDITISNLSTAKATKTYAMQFWIFAYDYVPDKFGGVSFAWNYHNQITVEKTGASTYEFICYPFYDSTAPAYKASKNIKIAFSKQAWNYITCSVDLNGKKIYLNTETNVSEVVFTEAYPPNFDTKVHSDLVIKDLATDPEWGVLFFRQIRLWQEIFPNTGFLSRVDIQTPALFGTLLALWDPIYTGTAQITEIKGAANTAITYTSSIGENIVDDSKYSTLFLCSEDTQYYDITTTSCTQFANLINIQDLTFPNIASSYAGNYTSEFWIFTENFNDVTNGVNVIYDNHVSISVIKTTADYLGGYCFPQAYKDDIKSLRGSSIEAAFNAAKNKAVKNLATQVGVWSWVRCAVSNFEKKYYISDDPIQTLEAEILYNTTKTDYPYRHFYADSLKVDLKIENISQQTKKIYVRNLYVFNDYIPQNYLFKYMDMSNLTAATFPSLIFACNFSNFVTATNNLSYTTYKYGNPNTSTTLLVNSISGGASALAANFEALQLCNPASDERYNTATKTCMPIASCLKASLKCSYCVEETTCLQCDSNYYYNAPLATGQTCASSCPANTPRSPGSVSLSAICNSTCSDTISCPVASPGQLQDFPANFSCLATHKRSSYKCLLDADDKKSSLFFSRCYNSPNFTHDLSVATKTAIASGHILELWYKRDTLFNACAHVTSINPIKEYYLYAPPHSIYRNHSTNNFYYEVTMDNTKNKQIVVNKHEWNNIIIKMVKTGTDQTISIYTNFDLENPVYTNNTVPLGTDLTLSSIVFCSGANGTCSPNGVPITINWGSAYYKNFRVWDVSSATEWLVQTFNNNLYTEILKSLILYYPLNASNLDLNKFTNLVGATNFIDLEPAYTGTLNWTADKNMLFNFSSKFDWGADNPGKVLSSMTGVITTSIDAHINCKRAYSGASTDCYECNTGFVGRAKSCINITNYYLKTPPTVATTTPIPLKIINSPTFDILAEISVTICFWMRFFGINSAAISSQPIIFSINSNTFFGYDINTKELIFMQNSQKVFKDDKFVDQIGQWTLVTYANYKANTINSYYPNMMGASINKKDLPMEAAYSIPATGISINRAEIGYEVVGLFADFRFYNKYIQGAFGLIMSSNTKRAENLITSISLSANTANACISDADLNGATVIALGISCIADYNIYLDTNVQCTDDTKYFDLSLTSSPPCDPCEKSCNTLCIGKTTEECTCNLAEGQFWLRNHIVDKHAYCDKVTNVDFSTFDAVQIDNLLPTKTEEYTLELWVYVYSYSSANIQFDKIDISWNLHSRITLFNKSNSLNIDCYSLVDLTDMTKYTEKNSEVISYSAWTFVRCGGDRLNKKFFLNSVEYDLQTPLPPLPTTSSLKIEMPSTATINWGFLYLRNINLWQQSNFKYVNVERMNLKHNTNTYPGLLHSFLANHNNSTIVDYVKWSETELKRRVTFIGYNFVDPLGNYKDLILCNDGDVYDQTLKACVTKAPTLDTNCEIIGTTTESCIKCKGLYKYINPVDGICVQKCPESNYGNDIINQCRVCHTECFECDGFLNNNCLACTDTSYLVPDSKVCTLICEKYGLTVSKATANLCSKFDANAKITNLDLTQKLNPKKISKITAEVTDATTDAYTTKWQFDHTCTTLANANNTGVTIQPDGFFINNLTTLDGQVNTTAIEAGKTYCFDLVISSEKLGEIITVKKSWNITIAMGPVNGKLFVLPSTGFRNTTVFILSCDSFTSEAGTGTLEYRFYTIEEGTSVETTIFDFSKINEYTTVFNSKFFSVEFLNLQVSCEARDEFGSTTKASKNITIVNDPTSTRYNISDVLKDYTTPTDITSVKRIKMFCEFLRSLVKDLIKEVNPVFLHSSVKPSLDSSKFNVLDPSCTKDYCNGDIKGRCDLVDRSLVCKCELAYVGLHCQVLKEVIPKLRGAYQEIYKLLLTTLATDLSQDQLEAFQFLFLGTVDFEQDSTFFTTKLFEFITLAKSAFPNSIYNNKNTYFGLLDSYYKFEYDRMNKKKALNKNLTDYPFKNVTLLSDDYADFKGKFESLNSQIEKLAKFVMSGGADKTKGYSFKGEYVEIDIMYVTPTFKAADYFIAKKDAYKSWVDFTACLNFIEVTGRNNQYFTNYAVFTEFNFSPFAFDPNIYGNLTTPYVTLKIYDGSTQTNEELIITKCITDPIILNFPMQASNWILEEINKKKSLYNESNYLSPDNAIFKSPIYINASGYVSNDTSTDRQIKHQRNLNLSGQYYDSTNGVFKTDGLSYLNMDSNFIQITTEHLTGFVGTITDNPVVFTTDGPFFYVSFPQVFRNWKNYSSNYAFFTAAVLIVYLLLVVVISTISDWKYFQKEVLLNFLCEQIVEFNTPYMQNKQFDHNNVYPEVSKKNKQANGNNGLNFDDILDNKIPEGEDYPKDDFVGVHIPKIDNSYDNKDKNKNNNNELNLMKFDDIDEIQFNYSLDNKQEQEKNAYMNNLFVSADREKSTIRKLGGDDFNSANQATDKKDVIKLENVNLAKADEVVKTDPDEIRKERLEGFNDIVLSGCEFWRWNMRHRHVMLSAFNYISAFHLRYMKLMMFVSQCSIYMFMLAIFLTNDTLTLQSAVFGTFTIIGIPNLILYSIVSCIVSCIIMYPMAWWFTFPKSDRKKLYKVVQSGKRIKVLALWDKIQSKKHLKTAVGIILHIVIMGCSFYVSISFVAVWKVMANSWLAGFIITFVLDIIINEIVFEGFIAFLYARRKTSPCSLFNAEWLNRIRNYRYLWP